MVTNPPLLNQIEGFPLDYLSKHSPRKVTEISGQHESHRQKKLQGYQIQPLSCEQGMHPSKPVFFIELLTTSSVHLHTGMLLIQMVVVQQTSVRYFPHRCSLVWELQAWPCSVRKSKRNTGIKTNTEFQALFYSDGHDCTCRNCMVLKMPEQLDSSVSRILLFVQTLH